MLTHDELVAGLRAAGVHAGDVMLVQSNLRRFGTVDAPRNRDGIAQFYVDALQAALGPEGTLVVLTAYEDYARHGLPYDRQSSPSLSGALSEYVRTRPGAIRSCHPVLSLTALGARADELCGGNHFEGFGYDSPWGRLHRMNGRLMSLGYGVVPDGFTFMHYLENLYGVPYQYTKVFDYPVLDGGAPVPGCFTMPVRYLDFDIDYDQRRLKQGMLDKGLATLTPCGRGVIFCTTCEAVVEHGVEAFAADRYVMLVQPPAFRRGEIPYDMKHPVRPVGETPR